MTLNIRYTIHASRIELELTGDVSSTVEGHIYGVLPHKWPSGDRLLSVVPSRRRDRADEVYVRVQDSPGSEMGPRLLALDAVTGAWSFMEDDASWRQEGLLLEIVVKKGNLQAVVGVGLALDFTLDLAKLPRPKNPASKDPLEPKPEITLPHPLEHGKRLDKLPKVAESLKGPRRFP